MSALAPKTTSHALFEKLNPEIEADFYNIKVGILLRYFLSAE